MTLRYLTKSRFKLAMECPTKLYYTNKKEQFDNQKSGDSFLAALAEGGMQVGELAKCYFPNGHDIETLNNEAALQQTTELLKKENVVIYEAAIAYNNLLIRVDILQKQGNDIHLIEVKAKSFDANEDKFVGKIGKKERIISDWKAYLEDIAFQKYVVKKAFPHTNVSAYLMLADKTVTVATDGLNQKLRVSREGNRIIVKTVGITQADLQPQILCQIPVNEVCDKIYQTTYTDKKLPFDELVTHFASHYEYDQEIVTDIGNQCRKCEFDSDIFTRSGRKRCWQRQLGWQKSDFTVPTVLDIGNFSKADNFIKQGKIKLTDISIDDINPDTDKNKLTRKQRQWLQVEKYQNQDTSPWLDKAKLQAEINRWTYPLHFIDFETSQVAIPFTQGRRPYEAIAFQFSHHKVYADGRIEHAGQFLNAKPNAFPNYEFIRELKQQLEQDDGTIFCYSPHENTYLTHIYRQLEADTTVADREELITFIKSITHSSSDEKDKSKQWQGERDMVDMIKLVKDYYYDPYTQGSNSIKDVLPGIIKQSNALQNKYSQAIYGSNAMLSSLNFKDWQWLTQDNGEWQNPYQRLPKLFDDLDEAEMAYITHLDEINDGGSALTAYVRLQSDEMRDAEREKVEQALLKYCELDTLAMVMLYEGWLDLLKN